MKIKIIVISVLIIIPCVIIGATLLFFKPSNVSNTQEDVAQEQNQDTTKNSAITSMPEVETTNSNTDKTTEKTESEFISLNDLVQSLSAFIEVDETEVIRPYFVNTGGNNLINAMRRDGILNDWWLLDTYNGETLVTKNTTAHLITNVIDYLGKLPNMFGYIVSYTDSTDLEGFYLRDIVVMDLLGLFDDKGKEFSGSSNVKHEDLEKAISRLTDYLNNYVEPEVEEQIDNVEVENAERKEYITIDELYNDKEAATTVENELSSRNVKTSIIGSIAKYEEPKNLMELYSNVRLLNPIVPSEEHRTIPEYIGLYQGIVGYETEGVLPKYITTCSLPIGYNVTRFKDEDTVWISIKHPLLNGIGRKETNWTAVSETKCILNGMTYGMCTGLAPGVSEILTTEDTILNADYLTQIFYKMDIDGAGELYYDDTVLVLFEIPKELKELVKRLS